MKKKFGGMYVPEVLIPAQTALSTAFHDAINDPSFVGAYQSLLRNYVGRQTPVTEATRLQEHLLGPRIFLKREDLNHTGSHKINNALGQCLLAKTMGKRKIIAETGAGQHGVATATACAHLGLACEVFMGHTDMDRQAINVQKMKLLGATVTPVHDGSATLKEAVNAALRAYAGRFEDTHYCLGSALGPEPYPEIVAYFQRVIGDEAQNQLEKDHGITPNAVIACVGGGSNAIGIFQGFVENQDVALIGVEAGGISNQLGEHASRLLDPRPGVLHGCYTYLLQDNNGQIADTKSIAAGLDYPAIGPQHAQLYLDKRAEYVSVADRDIIPAVKLLAKTEGIIPALESAHAIAYLVANHSRFKQSDSILINLSGRGDKDLHTLESNHV